MNYDFLPAGGSSSNFPKKSNSGQLSSDLFSSNQLYSNSTHLFQPSVDKDAMFFNTNLRANGTTEKSDYFFRENGPSIPKSAFGKDHFSNVPPLTTGRGQISEIFSTTEKTNSSPFPRNSEKDVFPTSNGPMNFLSQSNRPLNSNTYVSESSTISSSATVDLVSMPPQAGGGRLSAFPQISQQQSQVAAAVAASSNSRAGAFVGSIGGGAGSSVGSAAGLGGGVNGNGAGGTGTGGAGGQFSVQQPQNSVTTVSSGLSASSGGVLPSATVNRSLYNQQHQQPPLHHLANSNSLGFTSPSRMSPNSFSASLQQHQQAGFVGLSSATKRSNSPSANAFNHTFSTNIQPGRGGVHSYGSVSPNLQNTNSLIQINSSNSAQNGRDSNSQVGNIGKLDPQDFPALSQKHNSMAMGSLLGREYLNMVSKMGGEPSSEFTMQNEDFPALPGSGLGSKSRSLVYQTGSMDTGGAAGTATNSGASAFGSSHASGDDGCQFVGNQSSSTAYRPGATSVVDKLEPQSGSLDASSTKKGIQTSGDGLVTNIPRGMVTDQFGIVGLLTFIRAAERDSNLVQLALGSDLQNLGLNLSSQDLFSTFQSPFAETPCRPQDIDFFVPSEYLTNLHIRERLAPIKLSKYGEDTLFYLFYTNINDVLQLAAAAELYANDWRYHKGERMWLTRAPGFQATKFENYEQGTYLFFDPKQWRKVPKEFRLEYDKLEDKPQLPNANNYHPAHSQVH